MLISKLREIVFTKSVTDFGKFYEEIVCNCGRLRV